MLCYLVAWCCELLGREVMPEQPERGAAGMSLDSTAWHDPAWAFSSLFSKPLHARAALQCLHLALNSNAPPLPPLQKASDQHHRNRSRSKLLYISRCDRTGCACGVEMHRDGRKRRRIENVHFPSSPHRRKGDDPSSGDVVLRTVQLYPVTLHHSQMRLERGEAGRFAGFSSRCRDAANIILCLRA